MKPVLCGHLIWRYRVYGFVTTADWSNERLTTVEEKVANWRVCATAASTSIWRHRWLGVREEVWVTEKGRKNPTSCEVQQVFKTKASNSTQRLFNLHH